MAVTDSSVRPSISSCAFFMEASCDAVLSLFLAISACISETACWALPTSPSSFFDSCIWSNSFANSLAHEALASSIWPPRRTSCCCCSSIRLFCSATAACKAVISSCAFFIEARCEAVASSILASSPFMSETACCDFPTSSEPFFDSSIWSESFADSLVHEACASSNKPRSAAISPCASCNACCVFSASAFFDSCISSTSFADAEWASSNKARKP
mmetsp:Transcript_36858/g.85176  ORF Transcript_36858/g.85176 Transcript_36858/m.85176 type:complete len:215 (+) Transcript_36858:44-688(+)